MMVVVAWIPGASTPPEVDKWFRRLQLSGAGLYSTAGARRQRRPEDHRHHLDAAHRLRARLRPHRQVRQRGSSGRATSRSAWARCLAAGASSRDHGPAHHQAKRRWRFLCRNRRRANHAVHRHRAGRVPVSTTHTITGAPIVGVAPSGIRPRCAGVWRATSCGPGSSRSRIGIRGRRGVLDQPDLLNPARTRNHHRLP